MAQDGDERGKVPPDAKGKGRQMETGAGEGQGQKSGSLINNMLQSARSSVTPSSLSSAMMAGGKPIPGLPSSTTLQTQALRDAQQSTSIESASQVRHFPQGAFHRSNAVEGNEHEEAYQHFVELGPSRLDLGIHDQLRSSAPAFVGPYSSAQALDAALHDQVRATASQWSDMDEAWMANSSNIHEEGVSGLHPSYDEAWIRHAPTSYGLQHGDLQRGENIDELLQSVALSDHPQRRAQIASQGGGDIMNLLADEEAQDDGMSIQMGRRRLGDGNGMTEEQAEMHRALHDLQNSEERADERIKLPDDDSSARTGIYAATPQEALQAIWDGPAEGERASALVRDSQQSGTSVSRKIRELLKRGSYVDDVYGLPPQLEKTIVAAEEEETEENKDRRAKAIQRLDALYKHLGAGTTSTASVDDFIRNW